MHRITLLCVGSLKLPWAKAGCDDYLKRLSHTVSMDIRELPASREKVPERQCFDESKRLLAVMEKHTGPMIVLDERGKSMQSKEFASLFSQARDHGSPLLFVIGGAYGFNDDVRARATMVLSLSDMVLPHELCRLFFLEQLYRAGEIMRGSGYHH